MDRIERIKQSFIPRKIEQTDTHDSIERHDPDFSKKKKHREKGWQDHDEDMTDISVESLIYYLKGLKKNSPPPNHDSAKIDQTMKKAIEAYNHQEAKPVQRYTYLDGDTGEEIDLNVIDQLINDLQALLDRGIDHITLFYDETFLSSLQKTVEKYQAL